MRSFTDLKEQRPLHYEPACQKDTKAGRFLRSRSALDTRLRPGFRKGSRPTSLASVFNGSRQISEFFCSVTRKCVCCLLRAWGHRMLILRILKRKPGVNDQIDILGLRPAGDELPKESFQNSKVERTTWRTVPSRIKRKDCLESPEKKQIREEESRTGRKQAGELPLAERRSSARTSGLTSGRPFPSSQTPFSQSPSPCRGWALSEFNILSNHLNPSANFH